MNESFIDNLIATIEWMGNDERNFDEVGLRREWGKLESRLAALEGARTPKPKCTEPCSKVGRSGAAAERCSFAQMRDDTCPCSCHPQPKPAADVDGFVECPCFTGMSTDCPIHGTWHGVKRERDEARAEVERLRKNLMGWEPIEDALRARVAELEILLQPFAKEAEPREGWEPAGNIGGSTLTNGDLFRAKEALR